MKWVVDTSGRFQRRPYYEQEELDAECEKIVTGFLRAKNGGVGFPISNDDLSIMVERDTSDLDLYADLGGMGEDVEGATDFFPHKNPAVRIARQLSSDDSKHRRLRTTLAHEYGHVRFHRFLWDTPDPDTSRKSLAQQLSSQRARYRSFRGKLSSGSSRAAKQSLSLSLTTPTRTRRPGSGPRCRRTVMFDAPVSDWMEWQAGYVSGAILMPATFVRGLVRRWLGVRDTIAPSLTGLDQAGVLTASVAEAFDVSAEAARVRLLKLGVLVS